MKIILNGELHNVKAYLLSDLLVELGYADAIIATAVNGNFVAEGERQARQLQDNDRLEVLAPMQGG